MIVCVYQDQAIHQLRSVPGFKDDVPGRKTLGGTFGQFKQTSVLAHLGSQFPGGESSLPLPVGRCLPVSLSSFCPFLSRTTHWMSEWMSALSARLQDRDLLSQSGGGWSEEDHWTSTGTDWKRNTKEHTMIEAFMSDSGRVIMTSFPFCVQEGDDKKFLITRLQDIHEQRRAVSSRRVRGTSEVCTHTHQHTQVQICTHTHPHTNTNTCTHTNKGTH